MGLVRWPAFGAYLLLFTTPLLTGLARGAIPLRPNEMLLLAVLFAMAVRVVLLMLCRQYQLPHLDRMDFALIALSVSSSLLPVLWCLARAVPLTQDDLLYSLVFVKYYALYRVFRSTIRTVPQVQVCLILSMLAAIIVAIVGVLQVRGLFGVPHFLMVHFDKPFEGFAEGSLAMMRARATSTLASTFATADLMIMNTIIALGLFRTTRRHWALVVGLIAFLAGCVVAGEFSGYLGMLVAVLAYGALNGNLFSLLPKSLAIGSVGILPFWGVIADRLAGFSLPQGVPHSWNGRWENLQHFFFPRLADFNWLLGVQPSPRLPAPEAWRDFVYLESGYVSLVWCGGLPLLAAFAYFVGVVVTKLRRVARQRRDAVGVAALAGFCYLIAILVLMLFDPHLTVRGSADLFFPLLAMSLVDRATVPAPVSVRTRAAVPAGLLAHRTLDPSPGELDATA